MTTIEFTAQEQDGFGDIRVDDARRGIHIRSALDAGYRFVALVSLLLLAPVLLLITASILATSSGPALFRQRRVGLDGREFTIWKFRSMRPGADRELHVVSALNERDGPVFKIRSDPRVTKLGAWLRRTSLDELPQRWNVVRGEMSLVGPRPALPEEVVRYTAVERRRLAVKPGLTGLWQVRGRSDLPWEESVRLDVEYGERWSIALEAAVLLATPLVVLRARGAY